VFAGEYENMMKKFPFFVLQVLGNKKQTEITFRKLREARQNQLFCMFIKMGKMLAENEQMSAIGKNVVFKHDSQQTKYSFLDLVP
jgi:hypothetical protein